MQDNVFARIIEGKTLMLNLVLDNDYLLKYTTLQQIRGNKTVLSSAQLSWIIKTHQKIIISSSSINRIIDLLKEFNFNRKYISLDLENFSIKDVNAVSRLCLNNKTINQVRLCYAVNEFCKLDFSYLIRKISKIPVASKVLLLYLFRLEKKNERKLNTLFSQVKKNDIVLNILPLPKSITRKQYRMSLGSYDDVFNKLYALERIYKVTVFYDFPCGTVINKHFKGFCPGYFTLVIFADGRSSFCKFSNISFGNILNIDKDILLDMINKNRRTYLRSLPINLCRQCRYYSTCGGGCLVDVDKSKQLNKVCLKQLSA